MKTFEKCTDSLYGARNAGYVFDKTVAREVDEQFMQNLIVSRGRWFVDAKLDELYDLDGDLYQGEDGQYYAVVFVYDGDVPVPLCWQKLVSTMKTYRVKPDYLDDWNCTCFDVFTEKQIESIASDWEVSVPELMEQVYENTPANVNWYLRT